LALARRGSLVADDNWLEAEILTCPGCGARLFAVIHSPFYDDHRLYCDRCPRAVEISYYDGVYRQAVDRLPAQYTGAQLRAAIEPLLRGCSCGGRFRWDAPRHCFHCGAEVPAAALKDLSPYTGGVEGDIDPTPEEQAAFDRFEAEFIGRSAVWAEGIERER
jgi:ribosomal protein S27AE